MIKRSVLANLRLDELTEEHAQVYAAEFRHLSPSGINRGLRTLRRALNLAFKWNIIEKPVKVELAKGEVQRDRDRQLESNSCAARKVGFSASSIHWIMNRRGIRQRQGRFRKSGTLFD
jgi:hypothetical protein